MLNKLIKQQRNMQYSKKMQHDIELAKAASL